MTPLRHAVLLTATAYAFSVWADPMSYKQRVEPVPPGDADVVAHRSSAPHATRGRGTSFLSTDPRAALLLHRLRVVRKHSAQAYSDMVIAANGLLRLYARVLHLCSSRRARPRHVQQLKENYDDLLLQLQRLMRWVQVPVTSSPAREAHITSCTSLLLALFHRKRRVLSAALRRHNVHDGAPWGDPRAANAP
jgi:hypothetical protein